MENQEAVLRGRWRTDEQTEPVSEQIHANESISLALWVSALIFG